LVCLASDILEKIFIGKEVSYLYNLLDEIIKRHEETIIGDDWDGRELEGKRIETLSDYFCWNLKLIDTEIFMMDIYIEGDEGIGMRIVIEKYQAWIELTLDGYNLKKETWRDMTFTKIEEGKKTGIK
jgi:hypothetical protein